MTTATSVREIGTQLVEYCRRGENLQAVDALYAPDAVSIEPAQMGDAPARQEGIDAIRGKNAWWLDNHDVHQSEVRGPFLHGADRFACYATYDVTFKPEGRRMRIEEVAVYTVRDGKIAREEFFYDMGQ